MDKHLHILCLDVPYPVDYGGVFDLFYKIKALYNAGIKIHLHCFEYGRGRQAELDKYCTNVRYYKRIRGLQGFSISLPYIVSSRRSSGLLENLLTDDYPILIEGVHCTYLLTDKRFKDRHIILRLHNVEYSYYRELAKTTDSIFKKLYYILESRMLFRYEKSIARRLLILGVSEPDLIIYQKKFKASNIHHLPVFLPYTEVLSRKGIGSYCLYHGNLSVSENEKAVLWLLKKVFNDLQTEFIIAGKNPSRTLVKAAAETINCILITNPSEQKLKDLIASAQIHILPSFNITGVKLKLLNALFNGRHCVINEAALSGISLKGACHVGSDADEIKSIIRELYYKPFAEEDIQLRKFLLESIYNNSTNVQKLIQWIW